MTDRYEVVLLVDASGAVKAFTAVSAAANKTATDLTKVGTAGSAALKQSGGAAAQAASGLDKAAASSGKLGEASGNSATALVRAATAGSRFGREIGIMTGPLAQVASVLPGASHGFVALSEAVNVLSGASGLASLAEALNPIALALTGVVAVGALVVKSFQDEAQAAKDLTEANKNLNQSIIDNVTIAQQQAAGGIDFKTFAPKTQLDVQPWTEAGQKIAQAVANGIANGQTDIGNILLSPDQKKQIEDLQSQIYAGVKANAGDQTAAIAAQQKLIGLYNDTKILGSDVVKTEQLIAAAEAETGVRGQVAQKQVDSLISEFRRTGDVAAFEKGLGGINDTLGAQALKALAAADAIKQQIDAAKAAGNTGSSQVGQFNLTEVVNQRAAQDADTEAKAINAVAAANDKLHASFDPLLAGYQSVETARATATKQAGDEANAYDDATAAIQRLNAASQYQTKFGAGPTASFERTPSQSANDAANLEAASQTHLAEVAQSRADAIVKADQAVIAAANQRVQTIQDDANKEIDAVNKTADAQIKAAEQAGHSQSLDLKNAGRTTVRDAQTTAQDQIRAATLAQNQQTNAARRAADAQISAAQDAADAQIQAAKDAADAQVQQAQRAEQQQVRSAQVAANAQIRAANAAAHDQVAAAQKAAHEQTAAADRLVTTVTTDAKAQHDAVVQAAQDAHDQAVAQANKTADAEIAAAKRSADQQIIQLQRRTQAAQDNARDTANKALTQANDQAARAIKGGADPGKVAKQLEDAQKKAYADQEKAQENATSRQQSQQAKIQAQEQQRIDNINAYKEQATKAADAQLQAIQDQAQKTEDARVAAATKQAADMKKAAAQSVAQVQRATDQRTNDITRAANRSVEEAKRTAAKQTDAVKTASAQQEANAEKAIQANLQATTDAANKQAAQVATDTARNTARVRADAERTVQRAQADTAHQQTQLARQTDQTVRQIDNGRKKRIDDIKTAADGAAQAELDNAKKLEAQFTEVAAKADPAVAKALELQGIVTKGASGNYEFILDDPSKTAIATMEDAIKLFGPSQQVDLRAVVNMTPNVDPVNQFINNINGKTIASAKVLVVPTSGAGPHALGGVIGAANGRVVTVGEAGPEEVILPVGSLVRPHPASAAAPLSGGGDVHLHIHGDVYGMDDFEGKVQRAAVDAFTRGYPSAHMARRRALGAA